MRKLKAFTSSEYIDFVKSLKSLNIYMDRKGRTTDNGFIERFFRTIKYDKIYLQVALRWFNRFGQFFSKVKLT